MKYFYASLIAFAATAAFADPRIHEATVPSWCKVAEPGVCTRGAKDYKLQDGRVIWIDKNDVNRQGFWQAIDADKFGTNAGDAGAAAGASK